VIRLVFEKNKIMYPPPRKKSLTASLAIIISNISSDPFYKGTKAMLYSFLGQNFKVYLRRVLPSN